MNDSPTQSGADSDDKASGFSLENRVRSFGYAFAGIALLVRTQHNAWIHAIATVLVVGVGVLLPLSRIEWSVLVLAIAIVWAAEGINTAIEKLGDAISTDEDPLVGQAKDAGAGAVLLAAIGAAIAGLLILGPHLLAMLGFAG